MGSMQTSFDPTPTTATCSRPA